VPRGQEGHVAQGAGEQNGPRPAAHAQNGQRGEARVEARREQIPGIAEGLDVADAGEAVVVAEPERRDELEGVAAVEVEVAEQRGLQIAAEVRGDGVLQHRPLVEQRLPVAQRVEPEQPQHR
jgi:hypothetical protein